MMDLYLQMILIIMITIGVAFIVLGLVTKRHQQRSGLINIVAYHTLDPRKGIAVAVMKVGRELLFLGVTPNEVKLLKTVQEGDIETDYRKKNLDERMRFLQILKERLSNEIH